MTDIEYWTSQEPVSGEGVKGKMYSHKAKNVILKTIQDLWQQTEWWAPGRCNLLQFSKPGEIDIRQTMKISSLITTMLMVLKGNACLMWYWLCDNWLLSWVGSEERLASITVINWQYFDTLGNYSHIKNKTSPTRLQCILYFHPHLHTLLLCSWFPLKFWYQRLRTFSEEKVLFS